MVLASQGSAGSARKAAKPPLAHCWPVSQSTAFAAGFTPTVSWASSAYDWRKTPSNLGSLLPYSPEGSFGSGEGAAGGVGGRGGGRAEHGTAASAAARRLDGEMRHGAWRAMEAMGAIGSVPLRRVSGATQPRSADRPRTIRIGPGHRAPLRIPRRCRHRPPGAAVRWREPVVPGRGSGSTAVRAGRWARCGGRPHGCGSAPDLHRLPPFGYG